MASNGKKVHISPKTGKPETCEATVRPCNYEHFDSREEAQKKIDEAMRDHTIPKAQSKGTGKKQAEQKAELETLKQQETVLLSSINERQHEFVEAARRVGETQTMVNQKWVARDKLKKDTRELSRAERKRLLEQADKMYELAERENREARAEKFRIETEMREAQQKLRKVRGHPLMVARVKDNDERSV